MFNEYTKRTGVLEIVIHTSQHYSNVSSVLRLIPLRLEKSTYANAHQEAHHIRLLLLLKFLDIYHELATIVRLRRFVVRTLEGTHL